MVKKSEKQDEVLDIVEKTVEKWRQELSQRDQEYDVFRPSIDISSEIRKARDKIEELIWQEDERIETVEQALLASLNEEDYKAGLPSLMRLIWLAKNAPVPSEFPEFIQKVKSKRGMKNSSIFKDPSLKEQKKRRLKGPLVDRINAYQMPFMARSGRNYGEYCTDFIEQNALELYMLGRLDKDMGEGVSRLKKRIEARNPNTKIFAQGIVKLASKKQQYIDGEKIVNSTLKEKINLLRERRDYGIPKKKHNRNKSKK